MAHAPHSGRLRASVEWRIVTPRGDRLPFTGEIEVEAWAACELAWGERRAELIARGYACRPFAVTELTSYRRRLDATNAVANQDLDITVDIPGKGRRRHYRPA